MTENTIESLPALAEQLIEYRRVHSAQSRLLVAVAGAPGAGKSTLTAELAEQLTARLASQGEQSIVVPMDGYHLDNAILDEKGWRIVKGSPKTFDVRGFTSLVQRLRVEVSETVYVPVFDREADLARNAVQAVRPAHSIVLVEGNYLLLERECWCDMRSLFDRTVMLRVPFQELERRLVKRWIDLGLSPIEARDKAQLNDLPNARVVVEESAPANFYFESV